MMGQAQHPCAQRWCSSASIVDYHEEPQGGSLWVQCPAPLVKSLEKGCLSGNLQKQCSHPHTAPAVHTTSWLLASDDMQFQTGVSLNVQPVASTPRLSCSDRASKPHSCWLGMQASILTWSNLKYDCQRRLNVPVLKECLPMLTASYVAL